jgi:hypothetical protein
VIVRAEGALDAEVVLEHKRMDLAAHEGFEGGLNP